jgi:hypothetical protein
MEAGRKRIRSQESDHVQQRKRFISEKIVEQNDKSVMEKIYGKKNERQKLLNLLITLTDYRKDTQYDVQQQ